jgi:ADP-ribose pyrophosphatase
MIAIRGRVTIPRRISGHGNTSQNMPVTLLIRDPTCLSGVTYIISMPKLSRRKTKAKSRLISSRAVYRGPAFWVSTDDVLEPTGVRVRRDIVHHTGSIVVLAIDETKSEPSILFEHQYRHAAKQFMWELPAGRIDKGEDEITAAKRELIEETGYSAARWRRVLKFYASPGFVAETMSIFLARGLRAGLAQPEADEVIEVSFIPLKKAVEMVMKGKVQDAKTISGVLWLSHQGNLRKPRR